MSKIRQINLETGHPTVEAAMNRMKNELLTAKMTGCKAVILIHGYGSSGTGGAIKTATAKNLTLPGYVGIVKAWASGENWMNKKTVFLQQCPGLRDYSQYIAGNQGITVVLLR